MRTDYRRPRQLHFKSTGTGVGVQYGCKQCEACDYVYAPLTPVATGNIPFTDRCLEVNCRILTCSSGTCTTEGFADGMK